MDHDKNSDWGHEAGLLAAPPTEKKPEAERCPPQRLPKTVCLVLLWISLGVLSSVGGTSVVDFSEILQENYTHIGMALGVHFASILVGLLLSAILADRLRWSRELLLGFSAIAMGVANLAKPFSFNVVMYAMMLGTEGLFKGITKPAANNLLMTMWGEDAPVPVNIFHFGYGVGAFIGPFMTKPFLSVRCPSVTRNSTTSPNSVCQRTVGDEGIKYIRESRIVIPFSIAAVPIMAMGILFLWFYQRNRRASTTNGTATIAIKAPNKDQETKRGMWEIAIVALLVCYFLMLAGSGFGGYLFTIAFESDLRCSKDEASKMASTFYAAFTGGRFLAAAFLQWLSIKTVFIFYVFGAFGSMLGLTVFGLSSKMSLWMYSAISAVYSAPLWPSALAWTNNYIHLSTLNIAVAEAGACVGEVIFFWVGGHLVDSGHISGIFTMTLASTAAACVITVALYIIAYHIGERTFRERDLDGLELDALE